MIFYFQILCGIDLLAEETEVQGHGLAAAQCRGWGAVLQMLRLTKGRTLGFLQNWGWLFGASESHQQETIQAVAILRGDWSAVGNTTLIFPVNFQISNLIYCLLCFALLSANLFVKWLPCVMPYNPRSWAGTAKTSRSQTSSPPSMTWPTLPNTSDLLSCPRYGRK